MDDESACDRARAAIDGSLARAAYVDEGDES